MAEGQLVMVLIIEDIEEVAVERVDVLNFGEVFEDIIEFFVESLLAELDLAHVEWSDSTDGISWMNDCGGFSLSFWEDDVDEICSRGNNFNCFEIVAHF